MLVVAVGWVGVKEVLAAELKSAGPWAGPMFVDKEAPNRNAVKPSGGGNPGKGLGASERVLSSCEVGRIRGCCMP